VYQLGEKVVFELPGTIVLDAIPEELAARPTLVWVLDGARGGERDVEVTYLSRGLSWRADYVLLLEESENQAALTGWVTIDNRSGGTFKDAQLKLVAGDVRRVRPVIERAARVFAMEGKAEPAFEEEAFFEYHLYTLQRRADVKDNQQKQILFFDADPVRISKSYRFRSAPQYLSPRYVALPGSEHVEVSLRFENTGANGLGVPIPQGILRVYKRDRDGAAQFLGEDRVRHTPKDETLEFVVGHAFDVVGKRVQTDFRRLAESAFEAAFSVELTNHKTEAIEVAVEEVFQGDWTLLESSRPFTKKDAMTAVFTVPVKPDEKAVLTYRVRVQP
jgi:hypothetical protein